MEYPYKLPLAIVSYGNGSHMLVCEEDNTGLAFFVENGKVLHGTFALEQILLHLKFDHADGASKASTFDQDK